MSAQSATLPATTANASAPATRSVVITYRFRLEPTPEQAQRFWQYAGARRWSYNWAFKRRQEHYHSTCKTLSFADLCAELTTLKSQPETCWLKTVNAQLLQQGMRDLCRAFTNFFEKRTRYPKLRKKFKHTPTFRFPQSIGLPAHNQITLPGIGVVEMRQSREIIGFVKSATCKWDCGHWFVTLVAHQEIEDKPKAILTEENTIGLDLGLKDACVTSEGEIIPALRSYRKTQVRRRKAARVVSRRKGAKKREKPSNRFKKAKAKAARTDRKAANQRADFLHKLSTRLVQDHDGIVIEDLSVKGLGKTNLAKSVFDAGMGLFRRMLEYKADRGSRTIIVIDRWFPSSQLCSVNGCDYRTQVLTLGDRVWTCPQCGTIHHRDVNAARNIEAEGLRLYRTWAQDQLPLDREFVAAGQVETLNARGCCVSLPNGSSGRNTDVVGQKRESHEL